MSLIGPWGFSKGDAEAGKADIAAAKVINPDVAEQFDHSESAVR